MTHNALARKVFLVVGSFGRTDRQRGQCDSGGGFAINSDLTWQAEPLINWQISKMWNVYAGYRWISSDYETGSGINRFKYDVVIQGFEVGLGFRF